MRPPIRQGASLAHYASLVIGFAICLYVTRRQWFFNDEWDFFSRLLPGHALNLLVPHNEHWSTLPLLVYKALFSGVGLRTYIPYLVALLVVHVIAAHLVWRVMRRVGVDAWVATALCAAFLVIGGGDENLVSAFQMGFIGSLVFGLGAMLLIDRPGAAGPVRVALTWLLLVAGLMCSGIGVSMVAVTGLATLFKRGFRLALLIISVPTVVYLLWLAAYGRTGLGASPVTGNSLLMVPAYIWSGMTSAIEGFTGFTGVGGVAVVGLVVWAIWRRDLAGRAAPAIAGIVGAIVFYLIDGVGRSALGIDQAVASRYVYISIALLLPAIGIILTSLARRDLIAQVAVLLLVAYVAAHSLATLVQEVEQWAQLKQTSKGQILAAAELIAAGAPLIGTQPDPQWAPQLSTGDLQEMERLGDLPPAGGVSAQDHVTAEGLLLTAASSTPPSSGAASVTVRLGLGGRVISVQGGCVTISSYGAPYAVSVTFTTSGYVSLSQPAGATVETQVTDPAYPGVSGSRQVAYPAMAYITVSKPTLAVVLSLPAEQATLCGAAVTAPAPS